MRLITLFALLACTPAPDVSNETRDEMCETLYEEGYLAASIDWLDCTETEQPDGDEGYLVECWAAGYDDAYGLIVWRSGEECL